MSQQLDMFAALEPPPAPPPQKIRWCDLPRRKVTVRAYGGETEFTVVDGDREPFELEVCGIACTISYSLGFCTTVIDRHGSLFWSESGFRSFGHPATDPDEVRSIVERYIDGPTKTGDGLGGELVRWWPMYATQWRAGLEFILECGRDRSKLWAQWGPEKHAEIWAARDAEFEADLQRMRADGIDPNDLGKPRLFKGNWPAITYDTKLSEFSR